MTAGFGFDLSAACAGFIYALSVADGMIRAGQARGVLVIGSEVYSRILNWQDRGTCVLFGDGAGAVFLRAGDRQRQHRSGHPVHPSARAGHAGRHPVRRWRGRAARQARPSGDERPRGVPPRRDSAGRGGGGGARRQRPARSATWTGWCRTRPICGSSMRWAASWACRRTGWWSRWTAMPTRLPLRCRWRWLKRSPGRAHPAGRSGADGGAGRRPDLGIRAGSACDRDRRMHPQHL